MAKARRGKKKSTGRGARSDRRRRAVTRTARDAQIAFEAISIEGGLLSPDWLARAAQLQAGGQSEADYRIPKGLNVRDEIGRYWRIAQALWQEFSAGLSASSTSEQRAQAVADRFVQSLLRESFGFSSLGAADAIEVDSRSYPIGFSALEGRVPVVIAPAASGVDALSPTFGDGSRRRSAFGVCQEFLNAEEDALWGLVSDGVTLRILRDNASLTRPAWIEADLGRIFTEERYADFAALWLLVHETRFGRPGQPVTECSLETWREAGREEGTRAREHLRHGVEEALVALGQGFLSHPENRSLRAALADGSLTKEAYFQELLRLVYRLIFVLTVEERGVLHPSDASESARKLYADGYSLRRLRERSVKRSAHDHFRDQWETAKIVFGGLASGELRLGLPALAGLFAKHQCPSLESARLENRFLLLAVFRLTWLRAESGLARVNWRDMGPEELGSVYESLLELVPQIAKDGRQFAFATGGETKGNARKTTGSYYTPDSLVQMLLDSALEPVVKDTIAEHAKHPVEALLGLSIVDPACGSGHFLLAAARRLASHVARLSANGTPSAAEYRHALRQVVGRSIYGVDLNPMAVELCKVSLWMEAVEPGLPLTFLNSHIQHGNALLGTTPELMAKGIPDDAWKPIEGDDKKVAGALKKRNRKAAKGQRSLDTLWSKPSDIEAQAVARAVAKLEAASDANPEALAKKESQWDGILGSAEYRHQKLAADAWCAAFAWPKQPGDLAEVAPTNELWRQLRDGQGQPPALTVSTVDEIAEQYRFFHWHLQFPQIFAKGGFDVVLGNPPWERVKLQDKEWFATRRPDIAATPGAAKRARLIDALRNTDPVLHRDYLLARRQASGESHFLRNSQAFPLCAKGDINLYATFAEQMRNLTVANGRSSCLLPLGIATDDTTKAFFQDVVNSKSLVSMTGFINEAMLFRSVLHNFKFCVWTVGGAGTIAESPDFVFNCHRVADAGDPERHFTLTADELLLLNPNTRTCPVFLSRRSAEITKSIYARVPIFGAETPGGWNPEFGTMFHMSNDVHLFSNSPGVDKVAVYEAKMMNQFNHRFASYDALAPGERSHMLPVCTDAALCDPNFAVRPFYYVSGEEVATRAPQGARWLIGFRGIASAGLSRTIAYAVVPLVGAANSMPFVTLSPEAAPTVTSFIACMNSFVLDFVARQKVAGPNLNFFIKRQLAVLAPQAFEGPCGWSNAQQIAAFNRQRVLELIYTAWDLEPFARDVGYDGPPFRWDPERRFLLRAELDAAFFHLYGIERGDVDYIMDTFPIVRKNDEKAHGEYRTKRVILDTYDAMADAARLGERYQTRLDPPPADPRLAHPPRSQRSGAELEGS